MQMRQTAEYLQQSRDAYVKPLYLTAHAAARIYCGAPYTLEFNQLNKSQCIRARGGKATYLENITRALQYIHPVKTPTHKTKKTTQTPSASKP